MSIHITKAVGALVLLSLFSTTHAFANIQNTSFRWRPIKPFNERNDRESTPFTISAVLSAGQRIKILGHSKCNVSALSECLAN